MIISGHHLRFRCTHRPCRTLKVVQIRTQQSGMDWQSTSSTRPDTRHLEAAARDAVLAEESFQLHIETKGLIVLLTAD